MCTWDGWRSKIEVLGISNLESLIAPFSHISCFTRHRLWRWQTVSIVCQNTVPSPHDLARAIPAVAFHLADCRGELLRFHLAGIDDYHRVAFYALQINRLHAVRVRQRITDIFQIGAAEFSASMSVTVSSYAKAGVAIVPANPIRQPSLMIRFMVLPLVARSSASARHDPPMQNNSILPQVSGVWRRQTARASRRQADIALAPCHDHSRIPLV
jgi:hypothetical protein